MIALMMEAASTSETSVNFYQTTRRNIPENSNLHTRHRENLKSHIMCRHDIEREEYESDSLLIRPESSHM
jgi:hypothetical protein